ncbi:MAG: hypothetical protein HOJ88_07800 [Proteobacteria bacterium]|nr:hypothetical protein [Pseudomonadota bacterium]
MLSFFILAATVFGIVALVSADGAFSKRAVALSLAISAVLIKLWLVSWQDLIGNGAAGHDEFLLLWLAAFISEGEWLGIYNELTLVKGPFLSIWMSWMYHGGIPLLLANQLLYVLVSIVAVIALRPTIKSDWPLLLMFIVVLYNPMTFSLNHIAHVDRIALYAPLTLLFHACLVGLFLRGKAPIITKVWWAVGVGGTLGLMIITREASVWVYPALVAIITAIAIIPRYKREVFSRVNLVPVVVILFFSALPTQAVSFMNWKYFDFYGVTEFGDTEFARAYGALSRVEPKSLNMRVPVSVEARQIGYTVSPSFSELELLLEGGVGAGWSEASSLSLGEPMNGEIAGGWFHWAIRDAASKARKHQWYKGSEIFYKNMADEINDACNREVISCLSPRRGFAPVFSADQLVPTIVVFYQAWISMLQFTQYISESAESVGQDWMLDMFRDYTAEKLSINWQDRPPTEKYVEKQRNAERTLLKIHKRYRQWAPIGAALIFFMLIFQVVTWSRLSTDSKILSLSLTAILVNMSAYVLMLSYIEVTSFLTVNHHYLYPNHALLCWVIGAGIAIFLSSVFERTKRRA